ncbi:hypothetical protein EIP91_003300 [Steccherinum ochraceum]|uniref:Uncharacterized protein n=1 Tax=Steccherinum ochraceum TaxID=92696 RepID=A0A4R0RCF8_9APHY|nr:hypothetical protein EIP91_003300 [Steccherinum ochraceum]
MSPLLALLLATLAPALAFLDVLLDVPDDSDSVRELTPSDERDLRNDPVSSRTPSPSRKTKRCKHHDSLPVTVKSSTTSSFYGVESPRSPETSNSEGFMFTLMPHRRQVDDGRSSFLSLDLAESQSMRSMSLRRKDTVTTKSSGFFGRSEPSSPVASPHTKRSPFAPQLPSIASAIAPTPIVRRSSREALHLPSPKPVPSINLPEPPASAPAAITSMKMSTTVLPSRKNRPSNLVITLSACFMEAGPSSTSPLPFAPQHRSTHSAPSLTSPTVSSPEEGSSYFMFSPTSPGSEHNDYPFPSPPPYTASASFDERSRSVPSRSPLKASPSTRSTATINTRNRNRSAALAALEGRGSRGLSSVREDRPRNFMSMSDDEDEDEEEVLDEKVDLMSVVNEEEGLVIPQVSSDRASARSSTRGRTPTPREPEIVSVGTASKRNSEVRTSSTPSSKRSRRSTIESFLAPLTNFIDFREDTGAGSWRSFVEIAS